MHPEKQKQAAYWNLEKKGMKTMKKFFAMFMALAMIMGMPAAAFAEEVEGAPSITVTKPTAEDTTEAQIQNVEAGVTIEAYRIVEPVYNDSGFVKYQAVSERKIDNSEVTIDLGITDPLNITYKQAMAIAKSENLEKLEAVKTPTDSSEKNPFTFTPNDSQVPNGLGTYKVRLGAGYWLVLVKGGKEVYNPMLLGVYYSVGGNDNTMVQNPVDANSDWALTSDKVVAKSSEVKIEKTANVETQNLGGAVKYTVKTTVPYYSDEYDTNKLVFKITDTLTGLELKKNSEQNWDIQVLKDSNVTPIKYEDVDTKLKYESGGESIEANEGTFTLDATQNGYTINFVPTWIKANGGLEIVIVYTAELTEEAIVNQNPHTNEVVLNYTNDPAEEDASGETKDKEKVYTFDIDGAATTTDLITKTKKENGQEKPLQNAEFTLYTDWDSETNECTTQYTNSTHTSEKGYTAKSDANGKLHITGLAAGTYYLKETKAPDGFTLNDTVYKIVIETDIEGEELKSWTITISEAKNPSVSATNTFTPNAATSNATVTVKHKAENDQMADGTDSTNIQNTQISTLPSTGGMGTTIFTIGGCIIMIAAAGLFFASRRKTSAK